MKITDLCVNGIHEPLGFALPHVSVSWKVTDTAAKAPVRERLTLAADEGFTRILCQKEGAGLCSRGELLSVDLAPRTCYHLRVEVEGDNGERAEALSRLETGKMAEPW